MTLITECLKNGKFKWTRGATRALEEIMEKLTNAPVLRPLDFSKVFEVGCDASDVGIDGVLS